MQSDLSHKVSSNSNLKVLTLAALGVVFGDIGTSPLYAIKEAFSTNHFKLDVTPDNIIGLLSLIVWTLIIIVTIKYVIIILRVDNNGEGGVVALMARLVESSKANPRKTTVVVFLGLLGASLFYGDGVITPAISVLSAVEGLEIVTPAFKEYILPITVFIITSLFLVQKYGTAKIGFFFGPIVAVWFLSIAVIGIYNIFKAPVVLKAFSPYYGLVFFFSNIKLGFFALSAVFLTVTGGEALYADMGHFGIKPIRIAWLYLVLPCLLLNYFGQGALLINTPEASSNPFFLSIPAWGVLPMVILATLATVIASQALITGAFSVTRELIQLGYCPRLNIRHTSHSQFGQIYIPFINWALWVLVIAVVVGFKTSSNLAAAYGIAVTITMIVTTLMAFSLVCSDWHWKKRTAILVFGPFITLEVLFFAANCHKIEEGGWFPLLFGAIIYLMLTTWKSGREKLSKILIASDISLTSFLSMISQEDVVKVDHTAVFFTSNLNSAPNALLHNLKHNFVLHKRMIFVTIFFEPVPRVPLLERVKIEVLAPQIYQVKIYFGFMEEPDVILALDRCKHQGLKFNPRMASYFLSREILIPSKSKGLALLRDHLFEFMFRNSTNIARFFNLPPNRVVELGSRVNM
jgi:KUP system potassium uptake protein